MLYGIGCRGVLRLRSNEEAEGPPSFPKLLCVESNGSPEIHSKNPAKIDKHDEWMALPPCQHREMMVAGFYIGNMTLVERVYNALGAALKPPLRSSS